MDQLVGPAYFVIVLVLLVFFHELGHFVVAKRAGIRVEEFGFGFPPRLFGFRRGETLYSINALPLGGFVRMLGEEDPTHPRSFASQSRWWRTAVLVAGSATNLIIASLLFSAAFATGWPTVVASQVTVRQIVEGSPAEQAGLQIGDLILRLNNVSVTAVSQLQSTTQENLGKSLPLEVQRGEKVIVTSVTPRTTWPEGEGPMGIGIVTQPTKIDRVAHSLPEAFVLGVRYTWQTIVLTFSVPAMAIRGLIPWEMARPVGPVGIFQITSQAAVQTITTGWSFPALFVPALISAGLAIMNLLPIPALDGGRLLFVVIEAVRGRRVDPQRESAIHLIGLTILVSLIIFVTYLDILMPIQTEELFK